MMTLVKAPGEISIVDSDTGGPNVVAPELAIAEDGTLFSVSHTRINFEDIFIYTTYSADGAILEETQIGDPRPTEPGSTRVVQDVVALDGGGFVTLHTFGVGSQNKPFVRVHDADGNPVTDYIEAPRVDGSDPGLNDTNYSLAASPDGGFSVMVGVDRGNQGDQVDLFPGQQFGERDRGNDVRIVEFNADGTLKNDPFTAHAPNDEPTGWADLQASLAHDVFDDGRLLVAHSDPIYASTNSGITLDAQIRVLILQDGQIAQDIQVFAPTFDSTNGWSQPNPDTVSPARAPSAVVTPDQGFAVLFNLNEIWHVQFFAPDGSAIGTAIDTGLDGASPEIAALPDGGVAILSSDLLSQNSANVLLTIVDQNGVSDQTLVQNVGIGKGVIPYDGLNVGYDGSIYVTTLSGEVVRYFSGDAATIGSNADESFDGTKKADVILGAGGNDDISGGNGTDQIEGGRGNDTLKDGKGDDLSIGGKGNDLFVSGTGNDTFHSGEGKDTLEASSKGFANSGETGEIKFQGDGSGEVNIGQSNDWFTSIEELTISGSIDFVVSGDGEKNVVSGGSGNDEMKGKNGKDELTGKAGNDTLNGGDKADTLNGGDGKDELNGGKNNDVLTGGKKADLFVFEKSFGTDHITDFSASNAEKIDLSGVSKISGFKDLTNNHLSTDGDSGFAMISTGKGGIILDGYTEADFGTSGPISGEDFIF